MAEQEKDLSFDVVEEVVSGVRAIREPMWYVVQSEY